MQKKVNVLIKKKKHQKKLHQKIKNTVNHGVIITNLLTLTTVVKNIVIQVKVVLVIRPLKRRPPKKNSTEKKSNEKTDHKSSKHKHKKSSSSRHKDEGKKHQTDEKKKSDRKRKNSDDRQHSSKKRTKRSSQSSEKSLQSSDNDIIIVEKSPIVIIDSDSDDNGANTVGEVLPEVSSDESTKPEEQSLPLPKGKTRVARCLGKPIPTPRKKFISPFVTLQNRWKQLRMASGGEPSEVPQAGNRIRISPVSGSSAQDWQNNPRINLPRPQDAEKVKPHPPMLRLNGSSINIKVRSSQLDYLYSQYMLIDPSVAAERAENDESETSLRITNEKTYLSAMKTNILMARRNGLKSNNENVTNSAHSPLQPGVEKFASYEDLIKIVLTNEELETEGYPLSLDTEENCAYISQQGRSYFTQYETLWDDENAYKCINCGKYFHVNEQGFSTDEKECEFHWGKLYNKPSAQKSFIKKYSCCNGESGSIKCYSQTYHVRELRNLDCLKNFIKFPEPSKEFKESDYGVFSIDCEMVYTTIGMELARVSVVDINCRIIYDNYVKPSNPIVDYITRYSGITPQIMENVSITLQDVQRDLSSFINSKTILVGHSLNSDLIQLKVIHSLIIDTSVLYPKTIGRQGKRSLKFLSRDLLNENIQDGETGHDSTEDAITCIKLLHEYVRQNTAKDTREVIGYDPKTKKITKTVSQR
uniref:Exonuclease domain-containing protein n=1 Tax=Clastoptera arizonana TaxID=38151 RepID=A0A1B6CG47_9HEMI